MPQWKSIHARSFDNILQTGLVWCAFQKIARHECHYVCAMSRMAHQIMLRAQKMKGHPPEQLIGRRQPTEHQKADFLPRFLRLAFDNYHSTHSDENRPTAQPDLSGNRDGRS